jgi:hypothetical protein
VLTFVLLIADQGSKLLPHAPYSLVLLKSQAGELSFIFALVIFLSIVYFHCAEGLAGENPLLGLPFELLV